MNKFLDIIAGKCRREQGKALNLHTIECEKLVRLLRVNREEIVEKLHHHLAA